MKRWPCFSNCSARSAYPGIRPIVRSAAVRYAAARHPARGIVVFYIVESSKSFYEANLDLGPVVERLGFVILYSCDLGETLTRKGIDLDEDCHVYDLCNYRYVEKLLDSDMRHSLTIPWRISVFTDNCATKIGLTRPGALLEKPGENKKISGLTAEVEAKRATMVDE